MPNNNYLLKSQRPTVDAWAKAQSGKLVNIIDRTCNYRDAFIEWQKSVILDNGNKEATIFYQTRLELTPSGKIRCEETNQIRVIYSERPYLKGCLQLSLAIPQSQTLPPPPPTIERRYLYPRDKSKPKERRQKNFQQQTLPLFGAVAALQSYANRRGEQVHSAETLLLGKGIYFSLDGKKIPVPEAILKLIAEYNCSANEAEAIVHLAGVLNPKDLLQIIEQIPLMRRQSNAFPDFVERAKLQQPFVQVQSVPVSVSGRSQL
jgi:hypothetical protein